MSNRVESLIDGGVRQRLDDELLIPRHTSAKASGAGAAPLLQPVNNNIELMLSLRVVGVKIV